MYTSDSYLHLSVVSSSRHTALSYGSLCESEVKVIQADALGT